MYLFLAMRLYDKSALCSLIYFQIHQIRLNQTCVYVKSRTSNSPTGENLGMKRLVQRVNPRVRNFNIKPVIIVYLSRYMRTIALCMHNSCARYMCIQYAKSPERLKLDHRKITARMVIFMQALAFVR